jgi:Uma2 family endonuclease
VTGRAFGRRILEDVATKTRLTLEEFLCLPETEPPSEYIDGEVIQKVAPNWFHSILTSRLIEALGPYLRTSGEGVVTNELRHADRSERRVYLPDINVTLMANLPASREERRTGPIERRPDFAIEVLSPGDNPGRVLERADFYMRTGVSLLWFVDPDTETVTVYRPGDAPRTERAPAVIDAKPVLAAFQLPLAELFAVLHTGE